MSGRDDQLLDVIRSYRAFLDSLPRTISDACASSWIRVPAVWILETGGPTIAVRNLVGDAELAGKLGEMFLGDRETRRQLLIQNRMEAHRSLWSVHGPGVVQKKVDEFVDALDDVMLKTLHAATVEGRPGRRKFKQGDTSLEYRCRPEPHEVDVEERSLLMSAEILHRKRTAIPEVHWTLDDCFGIWPVSPMLSVDNRGVMTLRDQVADYAIEMDDLTPVFGVFARFAQTLLSPGGFAQFAQLRELAHEFRSQIHAILWT